MLTGASLLLLLIVGARGQAPTIVQPSGSAPGPAKFYDSAPWGSPLSAPQASPDGVVSFKQAKPKQDTTGTVTDPSQGGPIDAAYVAAEPLQATGSPAPASTSPPPPPRRPPPPPPVRSPPPPPRSPSPPPPARPPPPPPPPPPNVPGCTTQAFSATNGVNSAVSTVGSFSFTGWSYDVQVQSGFRAIYRLNNQATFKVTAANGVVLCGLSLASYTAGGSATVTATTLTGIAAPPAVSNFVMPPYPNSALLTFNQAQWTSITSVTITTAGLGGPDLYYISYIKL